MFKNKNILITGGTGLIGRKLIKLLEEKGAKLTIASLDKPKDLDEKELTLEKSIEIIKEKSKTKKKEIS